MESLRPAIRIDLNDFKLHLHFQNKTQLTLHFNSPSRRFYLSVIALVVNEMKKLRKIISIPLKEHLDLLALLNESVGGAAGSSEKENLLSRIYIKWKNALPNLEEAPLFKVLGKKKEEGEGAIAKIYSFTAAEKDGWANLFDYMGSDENVRLKFAVDKMGVGLNETSIIFEDSLNGDAWDQFISSLKRVASVDRMKYPLPDEPSIAVLPFVNMSEDPKQEFLCDGMTEAIITALSMVPRLFVIARTSTFAYKGKSVTVKQVSEDLGVQYVLEGGLQRSGDRVRITVQLIDALTGNHVWAERYDRDLKDIFALQDEITLKILNGVQVKSTLGAGASMFQKYAEKYYRGEHGLDCYLALMEANGHFLRWNIEDNRLARRMTEEAIAMCPENPIGYGLLGWTYMSEYWIGKPKSPQETISKGIELAQKALAMDDSIAENHALLCALYDAKKEFDKAVAEGERAVALNPGSMGALVNYANSLNLAGRPPEPIIALYQKAIRLNPFAPSYFYVNFATTLRRAERFEEAVSAYTKAIQVEPNNIFAHIHLAVTYVMIGREKEAHAEAAEVLRVDPNFSAENFAKSVAYFHGDKYLNLMRKAGLK